MTSSGYNISSSNIIKLINIKNFIGNQWVHKNINLEIKRGEILSIIGGSGTGKTTLLRCILMLMQPTKGDIYIFNQNTKDMSPNKIISIKKNGV